MMNQDQQGDTVLEGQPLHSAMPPTEAASEEKFLDYFKRVLGQAPTAPMSRIYPFPQDVQAQFAALDSSSADADEKKDDMVIGILRAALQRAQRGLFVATGEQKAIEGALTKLSRVKEVGLSERPDIYQSITLALKSCTNLQVHITPGRYRSIVQEIKDVVREAKILVEGSAASLDVLFNELYLTEQDEAKYVSVTGLLSSDPAEKFSILLRIVTRTIVLWPTEDPHQQIKTQSLRMIQQVLFHRYLEALELTPSCYNSVTPEELTRLAAVQSSYDRLKQMAVIVKAKVVAQSQHPGLLEDEKKEIGKEQLTYTRQIDAYAATQSGGKVESFIDPLKRVLGDADVFIRRTDPQQVMPADKMKLVVLIAQPQHDAKTLDQAMAQFGVSRDAKSISGLSASLSFMLDTLVITFKDIEAFNKTDESSGGFFSKLISSAAEQAAAEQEKQQKKRMLVMNIMRRALVTLPTNKGFRQENPIARMIQVCQARLSAKEKISTMTTLPSEINSARLLWAHQRLIIVLHQIMNGEGPADIDIASMSTNLLKLGIDEKNADQHLTNQSGMSALIRQRAKDLAGYVQYLDPSALVQVAPADSDMPALCRFVFERTDQLVSAVASKFVALAQPVVEPQDRKLSQELKTRQQCSDVVGMHDVVERRIHQIKGILQKNFNLQWGNKQPLENEESLTQGMQSLNHRLTKELEQRCENSKFTEAQQLVTALTQAEAKNIHDIAKKLYHFKQHLKGPYKDVITAEDQQNFHQALISCDLQRVNVIYEQINQKVIAAQQKAIEPIQQAIASIETEVGRLTEENKQQSAALAALDDKVNRHNLQVEEVLRCVSPLQQQEQKWSELRDNKQVVAAFNPTGNLAIKKVVLTQLGQEEVKKVKSNSDPAINQLLAKQAQLNGKKEKLMEQRQQQTREQERVTRALTEQGEQLQHYTTEFLQRLQTLQAEAEKWGLGLVEQCATIQQRESQVVASVLTESVGVGVGAGGEAKSAGLVKMAEQFQPKSTAPASVADALARLTATLTSIERIKTLLNGVTQQVQEAESLLVEVKALEDKIKASHLELNRRIVVEIIPIKSEYDTRDGKAREGDAGAAGVRRATPAIVLPQLPVLQNFLTSPATPSRPAARAAAPKIAQTKERLEARLEFLQASSRKLEVIGQECDRVETHMISTLNDQLIAHLTRHKTRIHRSHLQYNHLKRSKFAGKDKQADEGFKAGVDFKFTTPLPDIKKIAEGEAVAGGAEGGRARPTLPAMREQRKRLRPMREQLKAADRELQLDFTRTEVELLRDLNYEQLDTFTTKTFEFLQSYDGGFKKKSTPIQQMVLSDRTQIPLEIKEDQLLDKVIKAAENSRKPLRKVFAAIYVLSHELKTLSQAMTKTAMDSDYIHGRMYLLNELMTHLSSHFIPSATVEQISSQQQAPGEEVGAQPGGGGNRRVSTQSGAGEARGPKPGPSGSDVGGKQRVSRSAPGGEPRDKPVAGGVAAGGDAKLDAKQTSMREYFTLFTKAVDTPHFVVTMREMKDELESRVGDRQARIPRIFSTADLSRTVSMLITPQDQAGAGGGVNRGPKGFGSSNGDK